MAVCGAEETVIESVKSVLRQSFTDFELIVVNSVSSDSIRSIISSFDDKRIRLIDSELDGIQALNSGIKASTGKYVAFHDADGIMHIDRLRLQYAIMEEFPEITICSSWEIAFGKRMPKRPVETKTAGWIDLPLVQLLFDEGAETPAFTVRRSFIAEHNLFFENCEQAEDYKFRTEAAKLGGGFYIDSQPLVYRRIYDTQISRKRRLDKLQSISGIKNEILPFLCRQYSETHPALTGLYNSYIELEKQKLISESEIYLLFHGLFMKSKDVFLEKGVYREL
jgi:glycosyltransferase involved in cell wall biosynthesis